jgi:spermidine synthase
MGATLPLLSQAFARRAGGTGAAVARLYGVNTLGAFAGSASAGFGLLPVLGLWGSTVTAALLNVVAGVVAILASGGEGETPRAAQVVDSAGVRPSSVAIGPRTLLLLYGLSGFAAMAYQVAWTRALILSIGASTYAFSAIVACFILGLGLGSVLIAPWVRRIRDPLSVAGLLEGGIGLSALLVVPLFGELPGLVERLANSLDATFASILTIEVLTVLGLLIVPTLCMGALLPLVCAAYEAARFSRASARGAADPARTAGRSVGAVYASNTVGTILGAAVTGFVFIPWSVVGMQRTIGLASLMSVAIGTAFLIRSGKGRATRTRVVVAAGWVAVVMLLAVTDPWSKSVMVSGPYLGRGESSQPEVLFYSEGIDTTVAVTGEEGYRALRVNGKPDASNGAIDMHTQTLLGQIPMLLKPDARRVAIIGLGAGVTAAAALTHPVESVDVVEISSAVIEASDFFVAENRDALADPRLRLHRADGRNFLLLTDRNFDVVVSEPSNPWMSGVANLFTADFFEIARSRLVPGGIHAQWIHGYSMNADDFAAILATMAGVFEHVQVWETGFLDYVILGSDEPIVIDVEGLYLAAGRLDVNTMLSAIFINDPMQIAHYYVADAEDLGDWIGDQELLVDNRPRLEFSAPRYLVHGTASEIDRALLSSDGTPELVGDPSSMLNQEFRATLLRGREAKRALFNARGAVQSGDYREAFEAVIHAAANAPDDQRALRSIGGRLQEVLDDGGESQRPAVDETYRRIAEIAPAILEFRGEDSGPPEFTWPLGMPLPPIRDPEHAALIRRANQLAAAGNAVEAVATVQRAAHRFPTSLTAIGMTGAWALEVHGPDAAMPYLLKAWIMRPENPEAGYHLARAYSMRGDVDRALDFLETAIRLGFNDRSRIEGSPAFAPLAGEARFRELVRSIGGRTTVP